MHAVADTKRAGRRQQRPAWQSPLVLTTIGALLVGVAIITLAGAFKFGASTASRVVTPETSYAGLSVDRTSVGSASAPVVIEIYSDFQCPACKLFVTTELPSLLRDFVQPGLVRLESVDIDILDRASSTESLELAAGAACAADQDRYWAYHDLVFWNQGRENRGDHDAAFIARMAAAAGLDPGAFGACLTRNDIRQPVKARTSAAAASGISVTPTLRINGQVFAGVPDYAQLSAFLRSLVVASPVPSPAPS